MARFLYVDDESASRQLIQKAFGGKGCEVVTVPDAQQALAAVTSQPFDAVLLDLEIPGESGFSLLHKIRKVNASIPVVIYSGKITPDIEKEARQAGATEIFSKETAIFQLIDRLLKIAQPKSQDSSGSPKRSILITDDDPGIRSLLDKFLRSKGYPTLLAESGEQAILLLQTENPSVVLLDYSMPGGMDGLATLKKLREIRPEIGVVMATANQEDDHVRKAMELGAYGYVLKPFDLTYLELVVLSRLQLAAASSP